jgi:transcriptional antiterminator Rof (Rho-off)
MSDYHPIACARHEALELAILRGQWLRLDLHTSHPVPDPPTELLALPLDIGVADGAEWLLVRDVQGNEHRLRLDQIRSETPADRPQGGAPPR